MPPILRLLSSLCLVIIGASPLHAETFSQLKTRLVTDAIVVATGPAEVRSTLTIKTSAGEHTLKIVDLNVVITTAGGERLTVIRCHIHATNPERAVVVDSGVRNYEDGSPKNRDQNPFYAGKSVLDASFGANKYTVPDKIYSNDKVIRIRLLAGNTGGAGNTEITPGTIIHVSIAYDDAGQPFPFFVLSE